VLQLVQAWEAAFFDETKKPAVDQVDGGAGKMLVPVLDHSPPSTSGDVYNNAFNNGDRINWTTDGHDFFSIEKNVV